LWSLNLKKQKQKNLNKKTREQPINRPTKEKEKVKKKRWLVDFKAPFSLQFEPF